MSKPYYTDLPDDAYGAAQCNVDNHRRLRVNYSPAINKGERGLLHAHIGGVSISMTERNWRALWAALSELNVTEPPVRINFDDEAGEAHVEVTA